LRISPPALVSRRASERPSSATTVQRRLESAVACRIDTGSFRPVQRSCLRRIVWISVRSLRSCGESGV
jgi:hypothetical protein